MSLRNAFRSFSEKVEKAISFKKISPLVGVSRSPRRCKSVDFPEPEEPRIATFFPSSISNEMGPKFHCSSPRTYCRERFSSRIKKKENTRFSISFFCGEGRSFPLFQTTSFKAGAFSLSCSVFLKNDKNKTDCWILRFTKKGSTHESRTSVKNTQKILIEKSFLF